MPASSDATPLPIPMDRVAKFVGQVSHDIRNGLNAIDLQATLITELSTDADIADEAKKLRMMVGNVAQSLQRLTGYFEPLSLNVVELPAKDLVKAVFERISKAFAGETREVDFRCDLVAESAVTDFELITAAMREIFQNAFQFRDPGAAIEFRAHRLNGSLALDLVEAKSLVPELPETWGAEPLVSSRRGGLGLGLYHARRIVVAHGGTFEQTFREGKLRTRVLLPLKDEA